MTDPLYKDIEQALEIASRELNKAMKYGSPMAKFSSGLPLVEQALTRLRDAKPDTKEMGELDIAIATFRDTSFEDGLRAGWNAGIVNDHTVLDVIAKQRPSVKQYAKAYETVHRVVRNQLEFWGTDE